MNIYYEIASGKRGQDLRKLLKQLVKYCFEWARPEHLGLSSIACGLALGIFTRACANGVSLPRQIASVAPLIKLQTTLSQRGANTSGTSKGGWSDGFE